MPYVTQSRTLPAPSNGMEDPNHLWFWNGAWRLADSMSGAIRPGSQTTMSFRGSAERDYSRMTGPELRKNLRADYISRYDTGHDFSSTKLESGDPPLGRVSFKFTKYGVTDTAVYFGPFFPSIPYGMGEPSTAGVSSTQLNSWGRAAIAKTLPTAPDAGIAAAVIELREGLPKLIGASLAKNGLKAQGLPKAVGNEFLNVEFGYKPLASDIAKTANAVLDFQKKLEALRRGSGQITRRRAQLASESTMTSLPLTGLDFPTIYLPRILGSDATYASMATQGTAQRFETIQNDVWFAGAYTYFLHESDTFGGKMEYYAQLANSLLGLELNPSTVWQITPWSWLLDWFADVNVFMTNISNLRPDSSVLRYGYIMSTKTVTHRYCVTGIRPQPGGECPTSSEIVRKATVKQRVKATPYGFGLDIGGFSSRRWSILGALGMTKSDRALKP